MGKTRSKTSLKSFLKLAKRTPFYRVQKYGLWGPEQAQNGLSVDRPIDRLTVRFLTIEAVDRPGGRAPQGNLPVGRPPNRPKPKAEN